MCIYNKGVLLLCKDNSVQKYVNKCKIKQNVIKISNKSDQVYWLIELKEQL